MDLCKEEGKWALLLQGHYEVKEVQPNFLLFLTLIGLKFKIGFKEIIFLRVMVMVKVIKFKKCCNFIILFSYILWVLSYGFSHNIHVGFIP